MTTQLRFIIIIIIIIIIITPTTDEVENWAASRFSIHVRRSPRSDIRCIWRRHRICQARNHIELYHYLTTTLIEVHGGIVS